MILTELQFSVLKLIENKSLSGPEIRSLTNLPGGVAFYQLMNRIKFNKLVTTKYTNEPAGYRITLYMITKLGKQSLKETREFYS